MNDFYVYEYLRSQPSEHGSVGSSYYIGKGRGKRAFEAKHHHAFPKDKSFIRIVARNLSEPDAFQLEMLLIQLHGRIDNGTGSLRNRTDGGDGSSGAILSVGHREKLLLSHLGTKHSAATRVKMAAAKLGRKTGRPSPFKGVSGTPRSKEIRNKIASSLRGRTTHPLSADVKAKISARMKGRPSSHKGRSLSTATRAKIATARRNTKHSDETKTKIAASLRRFRQDQLNTISN